MKFAGMMALLDSLRFEAKMAFRSRGTGDGRTVWFVESSGTGTIFRTAGRGPTSTFQCISIYCGFQANV